MWTYMGFWGFAQKAPQTESLAVLNLKDFQIPTLPNIIALPDPDFRLKRVSMSQQLLQILWAYSSVPSIITFRKLEFVAESKSSSMKRPQGECLEKHTIATWCSADQSIMHLISGQAARFILALLFGFFTIRKSDRSDRNKMQFLRIISFKYYK